MSGNQPIVAILSRMFNGDYDSMKGAEVSPPATVRDLGVGFDAYQGGEQSL